MLPDYLAHDLAVIFCGTAAGRESAALGHYYSGRGNGFWRTLHDVGLTPYLMDPSEDAQLPSLGIGLTDLSKGHAGMDRDIPESSYIPNRLVDICGRFKPGRIAFNGKKAAQIALETKCVSYGMVKETSLALGEVWVLPSTSGAARAFFDISVWQELASTIRRHDPLHPPNCM